jgi:hypothetical protein
MKVIEIIETGLKSSGFDGLVTPGVCGCLIGDISPASCLCDGCRPGYKHTHSKTGEWIISTKKESATDAEIECCIAECS